MSIPSLNPLACPRCLYERRPSDNAPLSQCSSCHIVFSSLHSKRPQKAVPPSHEEKNPSAAFRYRLLAHLLLALFIIALGYAGYLVDKHIGTALAKPYDNFMAATSASVAGVFFVLARLVLLFVPARHFSALPVVVMHGIAAAAGALLGFMSHTFFLILALLWALMMGSQGEFAKQLNPAAASAVVWLVISWLSVLPVHLRLNQHQ